MAKKKLVEALATAKAEKRESSKKPPITAPKPTESRAPDLGIITNPVRQIAKATTDDAMVMGWDQAIQKNAYENRVTESRIREMLDEALDYEDKADPSGRIEGLQDWMHEKRGNSTLAAPAHKRIRL